MNEEELVALIEDVSRKAIQTEVSKWATKQYFPDLIFEPGQVAMFNATHHRLMPSSTAGGGGHILQDDGTSMTDRTYADFQDGFVLTDDSAGDATEIDLDYATTEIADIAETESAGVSSKVPRADHVHSGQAYVLEASANYVDLTDGGATTLHSHTGGAGTLDNAYDFGGAGAGRTINTTDGAVLLQTTEADAAPNLDVRRAVGDIAKAALQVGVNSEANPRLEIEAGGTINLGQGGASVVDVEIGSPSAQVVQIQVPGGAAATLKVANIAEQITNGRVAMTDGITVNQVMGLTQDAATLTVGGQLTATHPWMVVTSNSGTSDDMDNLATTGIATADGDTYLISAASGHTITIRDNSVSGGNISTMTGSAITLDAVEKVAILVRDGITYYAGTLFSSGGGANHAILDGSVHTDSVAQGVTRGSLIYGNATPAWDELVIGAANRLLKSNGTDVSWAQADLTTDVTGDLPLTNFAQASAASKLLGRGSAAGAGDYQEITLGTGLSMSATTLNTSFARVWGGELDDTAQGADKLIIPSFEFQDEATVTFDKLVIVFQTASTVAHSFTFFKDGVAIGSGVTVAAAARRGEAIETNFTLTSSNIITVRHDTNAQDANESASHVNEGGKIWAYLIEAENVS